MQVKILHTGDVHLGMAFSRYPEPVRKDLQQVRWAALNNIITEANRQQCQLVVIAGDLFHSPSPGSYWREQAVECFSRFNGKTIAVLPGNYDYDDGAADLWRAMGRRLPDKLVIMNEPRVYHLDRYGLEIDLYPAPCYSRRADENCLGWIKDTTIDPERLNLGIAHGAIEGMSPDLQGAYFNMSIPELESIAVDLWLLGHPHRRYPDQEQVKDARLLVCGTPEPDGMECNHPGNAWVIAVDDGHYSALAYDPSAYHFRTINRTITDFSDLDNLEKELLAANPEQTLARLDLSGTIDHSLYQAMPEFYQRLHRCLYYLEVRNHLELLLSSQEIDRGFMEGSFSHCLLHLLQDDPAALQLAYQLIGGQERDN
ncbi:MAG: metallophosphoesterase family protein [Methylocystaceae bacterium]